MPGNPAPQGAEMNQLRQDAIRRAREMKSRARIPPVYVPPAAPHDPPHPKAEQMPLHPKPEDAPLDGSSQPPAGPSEENAVDLLTKDSERTLILLLLLILMAEKTDSSLIFALMYLLL